MKKLFLLCTDLLATVPEIRMTDLEKGQLNYFEGRPPVGFPCALIKIEYVRCESQGRGIQQCLVRVTIRIAWDFYTHTDSTMPKDTRDQNLLYFDTIEKVYQAFQGYRDNTVIKSPFNRVSQIEESRRDGLKVVNLIFETVVLDQSAIN